jgi:hypothetical protein
MEISKQRKLDGGCHSMMGLSMSLNSEHPEFTKTEDFSERSQAQTTNREEEGNVAIPTAGQL